MIVGGRKVDGEAYRMNNVMEFSLLYTVTAFFRHWIFLKSARKEYRQ